MLLWTVAFGFTLEPSNLLMQHRPNDWRLLQSVIVATTANQWRLKEGAKNDRLKKSVATFARRLRCIGRVKRGRRFSDARSAEHVIELRPRHSSVSIKEGSSPKSQIAATFCVPRRARFHYVLIQFHNAEKRDGGRRELLAPAAKSVPHPIQPRSSYSQSLRCITLVHSPRFLPPPFPSPATHVKSPSAVLFSAVVLPQYPSLSLHPSAPIMYAAASQPSLPSSIAYSLSPLRLSLPLRLSALPVQCVYRRRL